MPVVARAFFVAAPETGPSSAAAHQGHEVRAKDGSSINEAPGFCLVALCVTAAGCLALFFFADTIYQLLTPIVNVNP
jgi:multicomponent Na+:H+ antiporter subunit D